ncbi:hypothetical protein EJ04DRAFT_526454 [Polyplosphaeria fusca]|uniref:Uncharacterized protein n=1 Tax=Polyplosphaeria fusca TaxID=682080 RepID=A0A9P4QR77_9PLEO|nr:hypothetical protein EJ04DRAFT_526454 [Polyplosphaeria fusca]
MAHNSPYGFRNTPMKSSKLIKSQYVDYRASPTPATPRSRRTPKSCTTRGRTHPADIELDTNVLIPETDDDDQPAKGAQSHRGTQESRQRHPTAPRIYDFQYDWVRFDRIPGYLADDLSVRRSSAVWLYGVPIPRRQDKIHWYLCKVCHLQEDRRINAILKINGGGSMWNHLRGRHIDHYNIAKTIQFNTTKLADQYRP